MKTKETLFSIKLLILSALFFSSFLLKSQTNPAPQNLSYSQNFGTGTFTVMPSGLAAWTVASSPKGTQSSAESSTANGDATITVATTTQLTGGCYGYATSNNGRLYIQTSSNSTNGTNQCAAAIVTTGLQNIKVSYDIEIISAQAKTIGVVFQYRVGTSGTWTTVSGSVYSHNSSDRSAGQVDNFTNLTLPSSANDNSIVQLRWATWRGAETGNSSGIGIDNISITASAIPTSYYFRSKQTGNWNNTASWEMSTDNSNWENATFIPNYKCKTIIIQNNHQITFTASDTVDQLVVNGTLTYGDYSGNVLTINNETGTDLTVNGTFEDFGPNSIVWLGSSTWEIGSSGTLIRTRSTSANNWRDRYSNGISNIPATANWIIRKTSGDSPSISTTGGMYYPNLTIENNTASEWITGGSSIFTGYTDYPRIKGNFDIGGSGSNTVSFLNENTNGNPVLIDGNLIVQSGSTLRNYGTGFEIKGNLTVNGTVNYDSDDARKIVLSGANAQGIAGNGTFNIYDLTINKTSNDVTLNRTISIDNLLNLTAKNIILGSNNLTIGTAASISSANASSYIVTNSTGKIIKQYAATGSTFIFPTGDATYFTPYTLTLNSATFGSNPYISVRVVNAIEPHVSGIADYINRYWVVSENDITNFNADVSYIYADNDIVGIESNFDAERWNSSKGMIKIGNVNIALNQASAAGITESGNYTVSKHCVPTTHFAISPLGPYCVGESITFFESNSDFCDYGDEYVYFIWSFNGFGGANDITVNYPDYFDPIQLTALSPGNFSITLCMYSVDGDSLKDCETQLITVIDKPYTSFIYTPASPSCSYTYCFTDSTTFVDFNPTTPPLSYDWGDGSSDYSQPGQTICHTFSNPGTYYVVLSAENHCGITEYTDTITIIPPVAYFISDSVVCYGDSVHFTDMSQCPDFWHWNFGDGTTSALQNPVHLYQNSGTFNVTLTINNAGIHYAISVVVLPKVPVPIISGNNNTCDSIAWYTVTNYDSTLNYTIIVGSDTITSPPNPFQINWNNYPNGGFVYISIVDDNGCSAIDSFMVYPCCDKSNSTDFFFNDTISTNTFFPSSRIIVINGNLDITNNATLGLTLDTVYLATNAKIIVHPGCSLLIRECFLLACDTLMWDQIFVMDSTAMLRISGSTVQDAKTAIVLEKGAKLDATNNAFANDYKAVVVKNSFGSSYPTNFEYTQNSIYCNQSLLPQSPPVSNSRTKYGIEIINVNNIVIGEKGESHLINFFQNMDVGIYSLNSNISVYNNNFTNIEFPLLPNKAPYAAIYSVANKQWPDFKTSLNVGSGDSGENLFTNCTNGIYSYGNELINIDRNTFSYLANPYQRGTAITVSELLHFNNPKTIRGNTISGYRFGIMFNNLQTCLVKENQISDIKAPLTGGINQRSYGIRLTASPNVKIISNTISNSTAADWKVEGISFNNCASSYITCNTIENMGKSIFAGGASNSSIVQMNDFISGGDGFFLNWGVVGIQGQVVHPQDNEWLGTFTDHQVVSWNSNGNNSAFWTKLGSTFMPTDNVWFCTGALNCNPIKIDTTTGNSIAKCYFPVPLPWPLNNKQSEDISLGQLSFTNDSVGSAWLLQQSLYKYLILNDTVISSYIIEQFKNESDTGNLGRLEKVNEFLLLKDYSKAENYNNSILTSLIPEKSHKTVNQVIVNIAREYDKENEFELSETDKDSLVFLAQQCPYIYGNAVYQARLILSLTDTTEYSNDCELPPYQNGQKVNHSISESAVVNDFSVYPNPANDLITVTNPSDSPAVFEVYDYLGKGIGKFSINKSINLVSIKEVPSGLYIYKISSNGNFISSGKLIIIK